MAENVFVNKTHVWNTDFDSVAPPNRQQKIWTAVLEWLWLRWWRVLQGNRKVRQVCFLKISLNKIRTANLVVGA